jgi:hypothetical protein
LILFSWLEMKRNIIQLKWYFILYISWCWSILNFNININNATGEINIKVIAFLLHLQNLSINSKFQLYRIQMRRALNVRTSMAIVWAIRSYIGSHFQCLFRLLQCLYWCWNLKLTIIVENNIFCVDGQND